MSCSQYLLIFFSKLEWRTHEVKASNKYETTIESLESGKEYEFMILSQDRYNDGLFSRSFRYRTKGNSGFD